jgi:hypothetical protein
MPIIITHDLPIADALHNFPALKPLQAYRKHSLDANLGVAITWPQDEWPAEIGVDAELLVFVLPDDLAPLLADLALSKLEVHNRHSADLLTNTMFMTLLANGVALDANARETNFHPWVPHGRFFVALAAADRFVLACHQLGQEGVDELLCDFQATGGSSGPNYRPYRVWSDAELEAAARRENVLGEPRGPRPERRVECKTVFMSSSE